MGEAVGDELAEWAGELEADEDSDEDEIEVVDEADDNELQTDEFEGDVVRAFTPGVPNLPNLLLFNTALRAAAFVHCLRRLIAAVEFVLLLWDCLAPSGL